MYRIYRELELNLRIKPRKRLVRQVPEPLPVPCAINGLTITIARTWSWVDLRQSSGWPWPLSFYF
ncbi:hypothetical protein EDD84_00040 (plasmid) [Burkholderia gladioli]|nr:hypothetical protein EDD84_00040 [Burkholderia gladioli]